MNKRILFKPKSDSGFTLTEALVVVILAGVIAAISAPGWLGYLERRRLVTAQDTLYQALLNAQTRAQQTASQRGVAIREQGDKAEWALFSGTPSTPGSWESFGTGVVIHEDTDDDLKNADDIYFFTFDHKGNVVNEATVDKGIFFAREQDSPVKRGVKLSTLLGALEKSD
ncbi:MAG: prepilin-type N-terminal cleavage/methylation domain-containing protein [Cyanobacteria bacterium J06635_15]